MSKVCFGIDVGGTTAKIGLFDDTNHILAREDVRTSMDNDGEDVLPDICAAMDSIMQKNNICIDDVVGIGIGLPGPVDKRGYVLGCNNLGWEIVDVKSTLQNMFYNVPVYPLNDANAATIGENMAILNGKEEDVLFVTLGTGVGGGVISGGRLLLGANGGAGEIGHVVVDFDEEEYCTCGKKGCLEQYASATGIVRIAKKRHGYQDGITAKDIFDRANAGDEKALGVVDEFGRYLAAGLADAASMYNPSTIIIGGGVSRGGQIIIDYVKKYFNDYVFAPCSNVKFELARLGNDAGMYGAACEANKSYVGMER